MRRAQRGTTLIELVVAIVIITMIASTIIGLLAKMSKGSAETMSHSQAVNIASSYINRALGDSYANVMNYNGQTSYEGDYRVDTFVANVTLGGPPVQSRRVQVRVTDPWGTEVWLTGFKANH